MIPTSGIICAWKGCHDSSMDSVIQWCPLPVLAKSWKEKESEKENGEVKKTTKDVGQSDSLTV